MFIVLKFQVHTCFRSADICIYPIRSKNKRSPPQKVSRFPARSLLSYFENVQVPMLAERKQV